MDLDDQRESSNVEDRRGQGGGGGFGIPGLGGGGLSFGGGGLGCGGIAIVVVLALVFGINPLTLLGGGGGGGPPAQIGQPRVNSAAPRATSDMDRFVSRVLATTEDTWGEIFPREVGSPYQPPKLVLFTDRVRSAAPRNRPWGLFIARPTRRSISTRASSTNSAGASARPVISPLPM
jgi:hypothetical protein